MKTKSVIRFASLLWVASIFFVSCDDNISEVTPRATGFNAVTATQTISYCGTTIISELMAGENLLVGNVTVSSDENNLYVTFTAVDEFMFSNTSFYFTTCDDLPVDKIAAPITNQPPLDESHSPKVSSYTYTVPLSRVPGCVCLVARAEIAP